MASKSEIVDQIEALALHCRPPLMAVEQREMWMRDWCADLAEFPTDAIANACRKWRHSGDAKFPTAGKLLPLVRESLPVEKGEPVRVWAPATEAEYAQMTIREKIRENTILSHEAFTKAGPMFRNDGGMGVKARGTHLQPDEMPPAYRQWVEIGRHHAAEVKRLREIINRPYQAAAE